MKPKFQHECMNTKCRTVTLTGYGYDGISCQRCYGPVMTKPYEKPGKNVLDDAPLIQIELQNIDSVPTIRYMGEPISKVVSLQLDWKTDEAVRNPTYLGLKYLDRSNSFISHGIEHNHPREKE
jgi:hypothetical protein